MYGKIFESMYDGTLSADWKAMITFQQFIVLASADGVVDMTPPAISRRTGIPLDIIEYGIDKLQEPDKWSRSGDEEGRRILLLDDHRPWGWLIVNHEKYTKMVRREDKRKADRERINNKRKSLNEQGCRKVSHGVANVAHEDEDEDEYEDKTYRATKRVPKSWDVSEAGCTFALNCGMSPDEYSEQLEAFRDHEYKTAKKDWDACWRTWCRNWKKWSKDKPRGKLSYAEQLAKDMVEKGML